MRTIYTLVMYVLTPVILYRLAARGLKAPAYFARWKERFGWFKAPDMQGSIWVHTVSVGEFNTAIRLIRTLMEAHPDRTFVVTTVTPTGSERVCKVMGDKVFHVYLPYDLPAAVGRFLDRIQPAIGVVMETEIWPNLFFACQRRNIPVVVANARLSERSLRGYRPVRKLAAMALNCATAVAAQTRLDAQRLLALGGRPRILKVAGSLKYEMDIAPDLIDQGQAMRQQWGEDRFVFVAASTHEGDEAPAIEAFEALKKVAPNALMVLVPRHPERFDAAFERCAAAGFLCQRRSVRLADASTDCFIVDTMGELLLFYTTADVAFVGGSFARIGGHNVMEASILSVPVLIGPHTFNFSELNQKLLEAGGALQFAAPEELASALVQLNKDKRLREQMGIAGRNLVLAHQGAARRVTLMVERALARSENKNSTKSDPERHQQQKAAKHAL
ncbi:MAG: 3-deoxy-D-manno-octulosonic acid transferase [Lysobacteraceae bacterium]|nr:MAG: 3-deoxy-D-manno-octulosonic acid transferase [Xanthomonadaceae bacterium]